MILTSLRTNQLSPSGFAWYERYLAALDSGDPEQYLLFLHDDCVIQTNNDLPLYGKAAILPDFKRYWSGFEAIEHEPLNIYGSDREFAAEVLCHYARSDKGERITIPASSFTDRDEAGLVTSIRLYVNASPIFA